VGVASLAGGLVAYQYGTLGNWTSQSLKVGEICQKKCDTFAQDFCEYFHASGIQDIIFIEDKSYMIGGEYITHSLRPFPYTLPSHQYTSI
jgi:hypothetical protein